MTSSDTREKPLLDLMAESKRWGKEGEKGKLLTMSAIHVRESIASAIYFCCLASHVAASSTRPRNGVLIPSHRYFKNTRDSLKTKKETRQPDSVFPLKKSKQEHRELVRVASRVGC